MPRSTGIADDEAEAVDTGARPGRHKRIYDVFEIDGLAPPVQILSLKPDKIEGIQTGTRLTVAAEEPVEAGQTIEAMRNSFAVKHDAGGGEGAHCIRDGDEVTRPVAAIARPQVHPFAVLMGEDAEPIVLEFVEPAVALRHLGGEDGLAREDEAGRPDELRPCPSGRRINMDAPALIRR